jgi:hypothetical protein
MKTYSELVSFMRTKQFAIDVLALVESVVGDNFKSLRRLEPSIKTLNDYVNHVEENEGQKTVFLTVRSAYEFEYAIKRVLSDSGFDTVSKLHNAKEQKNDFGVKVGDRKKVVYFEVKTTQSDVSWTGSSHSEGSGKIDNYVLVSYELARDMELPPLSTSAIDGMFKSAHFSVVDGFDMGWAGEATDTSSFTHAKIRTTQAELYTGCVALGGVRPKSKWCKILRESLDTYRDVNNVLINTHKKENLNVIAAA